MPEHGNACIAQSTSARDAAAEGGHSTSPPAADGRVSTRHLTFCLVVLISPNIKTQEGVPSAVCTPSLMGTRADTHTSSPVQMHVCADTHHWHPKVLTWHSVFLTPIKCASFKTVPCCLQTYKPHLNKFGWSLAFYLPAMVAPSSKCH